MTRGLQSRVWRLGDVVFDEARFELRLRGQPVALEPKPLELLGLLLARAGEVVTKNECLDTLWVGRVVTESALARCMSKLRTALEDDEQVLIRTVHGYGYRIGVPVQVETVAEAPPLLPAFEPGMAIPRRSGWKLHSRLDRGGQGEIWLGVGKTGERRVFKFCADAASLAALKREITLARLLASHYGVRPDLVQLLDWNLDEPPYYLESEYCEGGNLQAWVEALGGLDSVTLDVRCEWVAQIAETLAAAHAIGVLHKDLKPTNILVRTDADGSLRFKLADWGSGRLLDSEPLLAAGITALGFTQVQADPDSRSGTPLYQPPEVLAGQPASVPGDIYALGVLLYQLAVGDLRRPLPADWGEEIRDALLREDLALCLAGRAERRLSSAQLLVERLRGRVQRAVQAHREQAALIERERLQASLEQQRRRRRWLAGVAVALGIGLVVAGGLLWRLQLERAHTRDEIAKRVAVSGFVIDDLLAGANPARSGVPNVSMREVLERASRTAAKRFASAPAVEAAVRVALGRSYAGLGLLPAAEAEYRAALARLAVAADSGAEREARIGLAELALSANRQAEARDILTALADVEDTAIRLRVGTLLADADRADQHYDAALQRLDSLREPAASGQVSPADQARYWDSRGSVLRDMGRFDEALAALHLGIDRLQSRLGASAPEVLLLRRNLGGTLYLAARYPESLASFEPVLTETEALYGPDHLESGRVAAELTLTLIKLGRFDEAELQSKRALRIIRANFGDIHEETRTALNNLALVYGERGDHLAELPINEQAYRLGLKLDPLDMYHLVAASNYARTLAQVGRAREALPVFEETMGYARKALPEGHWAIGYMLYFHADALRAAGRRDEARTTFRDSVRILEAALGTEDERSVKARQALAALD